MFQFRAFSSRRFQRGIDRFNLHCPTLGESTPIFSNSSTFFGAVKQGCKLNLKANFEGNSSHYGFKCLIPGAFNWGFIGSTCTALP
jgi:hypothetical protein